MQNRYKGRLRILIRKVTSSHISKGSLGTQTKAERQNQEPSKEATALIRQRTGCSKPRKLVESGASEMSAYPL